MEALFSAIAITAILTILPPSLIAATPTRFEPVRNFDQRLAGSDNVPVLSAAQKQAAARIQQRVRGLRIGSDMVAGPPGLVYSTSGFLTAASVTDDPAIPIRRFLDENADLFGYGAAILDSAGMAGDHLSANTGMRSLVWRQELDGIPVFKGQLVAHVTKRGELITLWTTLVPNPAGAADAGTPDRLALQAAPPVTALLNWSSRAEARPV
jgi:hypothetical protein